MSDDCSICGELQEWDLALREAQSASPGRRLAAQAHALRVAEAIIAGIEKHEGPAPLD